MFCTKCGENLPSYVRFCTSCGEPIDKSAPEQPKPTAPTFTAETPSNPVPEQPTPTAAFQPTAPTFTAEMPSNPASVAQAKPRKKFNPLFVIIPIVVLAAAAAAVYFFVLRKPAVTVSDFEEALKNKDFATAYELCEQLPESRCEDILEQYIIDLLGSDEDDFSRNDKTVKKMFAKGFDEKFSEIYNNYKDGDYSPKPTGSSSNPESSSTESSSSESVPSKPEEPELSLYEKTVGNWQKKISPGCYEHVVFLEDGTGYIFSDMVSQKRSGNNPSYLYYDGKIHFKWDADNDTVNIEAEFDPYCFVAYQGYAAPGHMSNATWKGSKNGSHDYYFSYKTQGEYLCDMLSIGSTSEIYSYDSLTADYWRKNLIITDRAWDIYFNHEEQMDYNKVRLNYTEITENYYSSPELQAKYEDIDLYHFSLFTPWLLIDSGNPTSISLKFNAEEYYRDN